MARRTVSPVPKSEGPGAFQVSESRPFDKLRAGSGAPVVLAETNGKLDPDAAKDKPKRLNPIKQKQMEERCAFLEEEVPRVEAALAHTEEQLGVYVSAAETQRLTTLAEDLRAQLAVLTSEWEELMMQLEA